MGRYLTLIAIAATVAFPSVDARAQSRNVPAAAQEQTLSSKELQRLAREASTPEDHSKLSDYYAKSAQRREQEAADYDAMAKSYTAHPASDGAAKRAAARLVQGAQHCRSLAALARKAAAEDRALASLHANEATAAAPR